jgi:hypothetical protein
MIDKHVRGSSPVCGGCRWAIPVMSSRWAKGSVKCEFGPGYRVYFVQRGQTVIVLLAGGDKRTQDRDIRTALDLARNL